jgi:Flp pilus assembly protein TadD
LKPYSTSDPLICEQLSVQEILDRGGEWLAQWEVRHGSSSSSGKNEAKPSGSSSALLNAPPAEATEPPASQADEKAAAALKEKGNVAFAAKNYKSAVTFYSEAIAKHGNNHTLWSNRSACYLALDDNILALRDAETCRSLAPKWAKGCYRLAMARLALNMYEDAAVAAFEGCKMEEGVSAKDKEELKELLVRCVKSGQDAHKAKQAEAEKQKVIATAKEAGGL